LRMPDRGSCTDPCADGSCTACRRGWCIGDRASGDAVDGGCGRAGSQHHAARRNQPHCGADMTAKLFAEHALLPSGWARDVLLTIEADGMIAGVERDANHEGAEQARGPLIPGMPNLHSHAFQRALAGRTGHPKRNAADADSFWTWRQAMYTFLERVDADAFEAIAMEAYIEMLEAGYTSVAEFHYVHHE